ncbi:MAG: ABC transporter ATP-binding protein, partial [Oscillospiraceae bacterium]|nr:ABC transporter ATP-binding protein [Oscillospiraceae bacterium]
MNIESIKKLLKFIGKYRFLMAFSVILAAIFVVLSLYVPILFGDAIDRIVEQGSVDLETVLSFLAKAGVCVLLAGALQWVMNLVNNRITYNTVRDIRNKAFKNIERLPLKYLDAHPHGDLVSRVISDVDQLAEGLLLGFSQFFTGVATIICTLGFMLSISPLITIIAVVLTPLSLLVSRFVSKYSYKHFKEQSEIRGRQTALIDEMVGGQRVVQAYSYANESQERFDSINKELQKVSVKAFFISSLVNPSTRFVNSMVYAAVGLGGAILAATGGITIGGLTCLLSYANQYTKPFNEISGVITELQNAVACATRIFELIEAEPEPSDAENKALEAVSGRVELENVEFSYTPEKPLINGFNLSVQQGQRVAIVGPTGCGKTTLINLLMRFYDVLDGEISVDGNNIQEVTRESLRRGFGMVLQETWLKNGTVRENIAMGKPDATDEEIIEAAKATHAHSFIKRLPN